MKEDVLIYLRGNSTPIQVMAERGFDSLHHVWRVALQAGRPSDIIVSRDVVLNSSDIAAIIRIR